MVMNSDDHQKKINFKDFIRSLIIFLNIEQILIFNQFFYHN